MKEINQEKAMLMSRKIQDHERRLADETARLEVYRKELALLQKDMNKEVAILQGEIDNETRDLSSLESEFRDLEKQYTAMKKLVAQKRERKQMLTAHMCTIISSHESRRADRLNELMARMSTSGGGGSGGASGLASAGSGGGAGSGKSFNGFSENDM
jgi:RAB6-interacting golgin